MYHSDLQSVSQYIRKRVAKKLPTNQSLQVIDEIGRALLELRNQNTAEIVENCSVDRSETNFETMDIVGNLMLDYQYPALAAFDVAQMSSPPCKNGIQRPSDAKDDVHALARVAYQLLTGVRPVMDNGALVEYQLDEKPVLQQELNWWQRKALKKALAADRSQRTPDIQSFLHELNKVSITPSLQRIGISLILALTSIGGVILWNSTATDRIQTSDRVLEISKLKNESPNFASFETNAVSNLTSGGSMQATSDIGIKKTIQFDTDPQKDAVLEKSPISFSTRKDSLLEKIAFIDEVEAAYQKILKIDPSNKAAKRGLNQIEDKYVQLILSIWETGDKPLSIELNNRRLNSAPKNRRLLTLRKELLKLTSKRKLDAPSIHTIQRLIDKAEEHIKASRFILPAEKNAVETYKQVLRLDPQNAIALKGLNAMAVIFENAARENLASGNLNESAALIEQGLMISPQRSQLLSLRKTVSAASAKRQMH